MSRAIYISLLWGLCVYGYITHPREVAIPEVENVATTSDRLKVAIIDATFNYQAPYIQKYLPENREPAEWQFSPEPSKQKADHGNQVALILTQSLVRLGITDFELLPLAFYSDNPQATTSTYLSRALAYAIQERVHIINISGGGYRFSPLEFKLLKAAAAANILVVVAAGNDHKIIHSEKNDYYPCGYQLDNVICVGSRDALGLRSRFSNYGPAVDVYLRGEAIRIPDKVIYGTSFATPQATAAVAYLRSRYPQASAADLKAKLRAATEVTAFEDNHPIHSLFLKQLLQKF